MAIISIPDERVLLTLEHAAALLDVSERSVKRLIERGLIRQIKVHGSTRIPRAELDRYVQALWTTQHGESADALAV